MKAVKWVAAVVVAGLILQFVAVLLVPGTLMWALWGRLTDESLQHSVVVNQISHVDLSDADSDFVVRPSPDLLYSICLYDLSAGPLQISGQVPDSYWSLQFYAMNTDNFAGVSNTREQTGRIGKPYRITLLGPGQPAVEAGEIIRAPGNKGLALIRIAVVGQPVKQLRRIQRQARCQSLSPN